jgi:hypothetical protein
MKLATVLTGVILLGFVAVSGVTVTAINPSSERAFAQEIKFAASPTSQQKIDQLTAIKGKPGSGDLMRKLYTKDLTPIGIQPGGAGMVVNLYSKGDDTTISLCTVYDVIVAVKKGKIAKFPAAEVK